MMTALTFLRRARDTDTHSAESSPTASQQAKRPRAEPASISVDRCVVLNSLNRLLLKGVPPPPLSVLHFRYKQFRSCVRKVFDELGASDDMVDLAKVTEGWLLIPSRASE